jgi:hypothetical protein
MRALRLEFRQSEPVLAEVATRPPGRGEVVVRRTSARLPWPPPVTLAPVLGGSGGLGLAAGDISGRGVIVPSREHKV